MHNNNNNTTKIVADYANSLWPIATLSTQLHTSRCTYLLAIE